MFRVVRSPAPPDEVEFVEKKGRGHPDSLADALAEVISYEYVRYCVDEFGVIPHHYLDKLAIIGGEARVAPGRHTQARPLRILLNGRFSLTFGSVQIPVADIAQNAVRRFLPVVLPGIEDGHWEIVDNIHPATGSSAKGWNWWSPRGIEDLPDIRVRLANDTAVSVARSPRTPVEAKVIEAEQLLFDQFVSARQCGSDIKLLAARVADNLEVTACVPVLAAAAGSRSGYNSVKGRVLRSLEELFSGTDGITRADVMLNTRDDVAPGDLYLLGLGTAAEHGDFGAVGRGNRMSGVITTDAPMSIDASWGKNPVYYAGLIYDTCARAVSSSVYRTMGLPNTTYIASQNGRPISDPLAGGRPRRRGRRAGVPRNREDRAGGVSRKPQDPRAAGRHPVPLPVPPRDPVPVNPRLVTRHAGGRPREVTGRIGVSPNRSSFVQQALGFPILDEARALADAAKDSSRHAAIWYASPAERGRVRSVEGIDDAKAVPGVYDVKIKIGVGDVLGDVQNSDSRAAFVTALGESSRQALERARTGAGKLRFSVAG